MVIWYSTAKHILKQKSESKKSDSWECGRCGKKLKPEWVKKAGHTHLRCPSCGHTVREHRK